MSPYAVSLVVLFTLLFPGLGQAAPGGFCEDLIVHDYRKPFKRMPGVHRPPSSGQLPFAPSQTLLTQSASVILPLENQGRPEYSYGFESYSAAKRTFRLNWQIEAHLYQVSKRGEPRGTIQRQRRFVGRVSERNFSRIQFPFLLPRHQAFYRVDLTFRRKDGSLIERYGQYLRVVPHTVAVALAVSSKSVSPGEEMSIRVENAGTSRVSYGEPFAVDRLAGSQWSTYLSESELGPWRRPLVGLEAGTAGRCQEFMVPLDAPAGRYRVKKRLAQPDRAVTAEFEVVA